MGSPKPPTPCPLHAALPEEWEVEAGAHSVVGFTVQGFRVWKFFQHPDKDARA